VVVVEVLVAVALAFRLPEAAVEVVAQRQQI
jgi:hypothetical protein